MRVVAMAPSVAAPLPRSQPGGPPRPAATPRHLVDGRPNRSKEWIDDSDGPVQSVVLEIL